MSPGTCGGSDAQVLPSVYGTKGFLSFQQRNASFCTTGRAYQINYLMPDSNESNCFWRDVHTDRKKLMIEMLLTCASDVTYRLRPCTFCPHECTSLSRRQRTGIVSVEETLARTCM